MAKNIVVFSDGTGQEGGTANDTNVYKVFRMVETRSPQQVAFYDRGLGTGGRRLLGSVCGLGMSQNILEGYQFIYDQYCEGDRIFLFGFSRGATTVRSLAGFIDLFGMLPASRPELIRRAYKIYRINDEARRLAEADDFVQRNSNRWCDIHFLGVWDTVAALGVPSQAVNLLLDRLPFARHRFHDLKLSRRVRHARHAVAIDDERQTFHPTLWDESKIEDDQTMKQVWFCGMHSDVGGSYQEHNLADITLNWMLKEAIEKGLRIYARHEVESWPLPEGKLHNSRGSMLSRLMRRAQRRWTGPGQPTVHESVLQRKELVSRPPYDPWILRAQHATEPATHAAEDLTAALKELLEHLGGLEPDAPDAEARTAVADPAALAKLRAQLDLQLQIAHALFPRGKPEDEGLGQRGRVSLDEKKRRRRERGAARAKIHAHGVELIESVRALDDMLNTEGVAWEQVIPLKRSVEDFAMELYEFYVGGVMEEALSKISI